MTEQTTAMSFDLDSKFAQIRKINDKISADDFRKGVAKIANEKNVPLNIAYALWAQSHQNMLKKPTVYNGVVLRKEEPRDVTIDGESHKVANVSILLLDTGNIARLALWDDSIGNLLSKIPNAGRGIEVTGVSRKKNNRLVIQNIESVRETDKTLADVTSVSTDQLSKLNGRTAFIRVTVVDKPFKTNNGEGIHVIDDSALVPLPLFKGKYLNFDLNELSVGQTILSNVYVSVNSDTKDVFLSARSIFP